MNEADQAKAYLEERNYKMQVLHDEGVHRCLKFMHNDSHNGYFMITTWPGHLAISGDMGCYVFSRIDDMVEFFQGQRINPCYWAEKLQASSCFGEGCKRFDLEAFKSDMLEEKARALESYPDQSEDIEDAFEALEWVDDEYEAVSFIRKLNCPGFDACDLRWPEFYTFHYLFACHAINYACNAYLQHKQTGSA